jgi:hypothetical protein
MLVGLLIAATLSFPAADVQSVTVEDVSFDFMRKPQVIRAHAAIHVPDPRISELVKAIDAAPLMEPDAANLGLDLKGHTQAQLDDVYFHEYFTDTGDFIALRVHLRSGKTINVVSNSQLPYMLPWVIYGLRKPQTTYNADIGRAAAALLPASAPSQYLLNATAFSRSFDWPTEGDSMADRLYRPNGLGGECLSSYVGEHPGTEMVVHRQGAFSLTPADQDAFLAYQYAAGRTDLIDDVAGQLQLYTWVTLTDRTSSSDWIAGPNNMAAMLWRHSGRQILGHAKSGTCEVIVP